MNVSPRAAGVTRANTRTVAAARAGVGRLKRTGMKFLLSLRTAGSQRARTVLERVPASERQYNTKMSAHQRGPSEMLLEVVKIGVWRIGRFITKRRLRRF